MLIKIEDEKGAPRWIAAEAVAMLSPRDTEFRDPPVYTGCYVTSVAGGCFATNEDMDTLAQRINTADMTIMNLSDEQLQRTFSPQAQFVPKSATSAFACGDCGKPGCPECIPF